MLLCIRDCVNCKGLRYIYLFCDMTGRQECTHYQKMIQTKAYPTLAKYIITVSY